MIGQVIRYKQTHNLINKGPNLITMQIMFVIQLEKIRYRIIIPEFYLIQICKYGRSVVIG